jgi:hypothetical protein
MCQGGKAGRLEKNQKKIAPKLETPALIDKRWKGLMVKVVCAVAFVRPTSWSSRETEMGWLK